VKEQRKLEAYATWETPYNRSNWTEVGKFRCPE
jgi:hypothetical protein